MLKNLGPIEIIVIGFVLLLLFGSKKLNELARGLGESSKEFKKIKKDLESDPLIGNKPEERKEAIKET